MGLFEHFPYTDFHDLNIDWLLNKVKKLEKFDAQTVEEQLELLPRYIYLVKVSVMGNIVYYCSEPFSEVLGYLNHSSPMQVIYYDEDEGQYPLSVEKTDDDNVLFKKAPTIVDGNVDYVDLTLTSFLYTSTNITEITETYQLAKLEVI